MGQHPNLAFAIWGPIARGDLPGLCNRVCALLERNDAWLRKRFTELGVIQFEDWVDTGEEYATLDEVAKDRAAAS